MSVLAGKLTGHFGPRLSMAAGYTLTGIALLAMVGFDQETSYLVIAVVFLVFGAGMGFAITPTTAAAMGSAQRQRSGIASGTVNAARQAGNTLGIAILGSIITSVAIPSLRSDLIARHLGKAFAQRLASSIVTTHGGSLSTTCHLGAPILHHLYGQAFTAGMHITVLVAGVITLLAAMLSIVCMRPKTG
jgi:MFS family permease